VGVFERILIALRERIPLKLEQDDLNNNTSRRQGGGGGGKQKDKVDVFRGSEFSLLTLSETPCPVYIKNTDMENDLRF
jgi:chorismate synthase